MNIIRAHKRTALSFSAWRSALLVLACCMAGIATLWSQSATASENQVKAVFLYNFTHFITWPESAFDSQYDSFVIGILGNDPIGRHVETAIANERVGTHRLILKRFNSVREIDKCHILFVASKDPDEIKSALKAVDGKKILTVGDSPNFARWGGMIRFFTEAGKIRLQINNTLAKEEGLKISSKLLRVAQVF